MSQWRSPVLFLFFIFLLPGLLLAGGKKEEEGDAVNGLQNWDHTIDISTTKPGKYNIIVEGKDRAGNVELAGPYNVYVDPESDIPVVNINNPSLNQRVSGNLNILGTAVDDDKVEHVEFSLDGGPVQKAEGTEYWSFYLPVADIPDGQHELVVTAYDINGIVSKPAKVLFDLDKFKPDNSITSHKDGVIVGGNLTFKGQATDANRIARIEVSEDGAKTFKEVGISLKDKDLTGEFSYSLDTRKYPDGPKVIWIRSTDRTKSVNVSAFLIFVDNTPPQIELINPGEKDTVHGTFQAMGFVKEIIGLESLEYEWNGKVLPLERIPGNPFFALKLDVKDPKAGKAPLVIRAKDTAGNLKEFKRDILLDIRPDYPVPTLLSPVAGTLYKGKIPLKVFLRDDDGVAAFWYQIDQQKPVRVESKESLNMELPGLSSGSHEFSWWAEDIQQLQSPPQKIKFEYGDVPARISIDSAIQGKDTQVYAPGIVVKKSGKPHFTGAVVSGNAIKASSIQINAQPAVELKIQKDPKADRMVFDFDPGAALPYGMVDLTVAVTDNIGQTSTQVFRVYVQNESRIQSEPVLMVAEASYTQGAVTFEAARDIQAYFAGADIQSLRFDPALPFLELAFEGPVVKIHPKHAGSGDARIVVTTTKGHDVSGPLIHWTSDLELPHAQISGLEDFTILNKAPLLTVKAGDDLGLDSVLWQIADQKGEMSSASLTKGEAKLDMAGALWDALPEGLVRFELSIKDKIGKTIQVSRLFAKDSKGPELELSVPEGVFGASLPVLAGFKSELASSIQWKIGNGAWNDLSPARTAVIQVPRDQLGSAQVLEVQAKDAVGNTTLASLNLDQTVADTPAFSLVGPDGKNLPLPKPDVKVFGPSASQGLKGAEDVLVQIGSAQAYQSVSARIDGKAADFQFVPGSSYGILKVDSRLMNKSEISIDFTLTINDKQKQDTNLRLKIDKTWEKPVLAAFASSGSTDIKQAFLCGLVQDDSPGATLKVQVDSGTAQVQELKNGFFALDLNGFKLGVHKVKLQPGDASSTVVPAQEFSLDLRSTGPEIRFAGILDEKGQAQSAFQNGSVLRQGGKNSLEVPLLVPNGLKELTVAWDGGDAKKTDPKTDKNGTVLGIPVPDTLSYGRHGVHIHAKDASGLESDLYGFFFFLAPEFAGEVRDSADTLYFGDTRYHDGVLDLDAASPLSVRLVGRPVQKAWLEPANKAVDVTWDGQVVQLKAVGSRDPGTHVLIVQDVDGDQFKTSAMTVRTDFAPPILADQSPQDSEWVAQSVDLEFALSDDNTLSKVEYALDSPGAEAAALEFKPLALNKDKTAYAGKADLKALPDGLVMVILKAQDSSGNVFERLIPLSKDTVAPEVIQVVPQEADSLNGIITVAGLLKDENLVADVEWSPDGVEFTSLPALNYFSVELDVQKHPKNDWVFRVSDAMGNTAIVSPKLTIDTEKDLPVVQFQTPPAQEVQRKDFLISGMVFDDDGVDSVYYRIDYKPKGKPLPQSDKPGVGFVVDDPASFTKLESKTSFSIPVNIMATGDNEHVIEMYSQDINGVIGRLASTTFKISTAEPLNVVSEPSPELTLRYLIKFAGKASDNNAIKSVELSFDNGNSWHMAQGTEDWSYILDSRTLKDGTYNVIFKTLDKYETPGMYATLINIDNTPPVLSLDQPFDGRSFKGSMLLSGRADDTIGLKTLGITMIPADEKPLNKTPALKKDLPVQAVILDNLDISSLPAGWYTLRIEARDRADNVSYISRDVLVAEEKAAARVDVFYPRNGEEASPFFHVMGQVISDPLPEQVSILLDGNSIGSVPVNADGFFKLPMGPSLLGAGSHKLEVRTMDPKLAVINAEPRNFTWTGEGPWITFDNYSYGDFVTNRPYLKGSAGYELTEVKEGEPGYEDYKKKHDMGLGTIELSFDNGRTFTGINSGSTWQTRLETQNFADGPLYLMLRLTAPDGEVAVYHTMFTVDQKAPAIKMLFPTEEGRFNETIPVVGTASDNYELDSIHIRLREGDKANYEVPSFIQGMYLDVHALGATTWEAGLGLTFFDDNVKLQVLVGQAPADTRFDGFVGGVKLIANVAKIPFNYFFGPDWDFFSMSLGVGADFSYFTMSGSDLNFDNTGVILGAAVVQWEFAKFYVREWSVLRTYSFYTEGQLWFISSDVAPEVTFKPTFGMRIGLF